MNYQSHGGTLTEQADSVCYISYWHVPNGSDYDKASARKVYFSDRSAAEKLAIKYQNPPELAIVVNIEKKDAPRYHGFTCPNCGSHYFGTYKHHSAMGDQYPHGTSVGCCHAHHHDPSSTCRFTWNRDDKEAEDKAIYHQTKEEWAASWEEVKRQFQQSQSKEA